MSDLCCLNCMCFVPNSDSHGEDMKSDHTKNPIHGTCHYHAPKPRLGHDGKSFYRATWPPMLSTGWCAQHTRGPRRNASCTSINQTAS